MRPVRVWVGLVLLALGVFGILDATDVVDSGAAVGRWWPVALVGLGLVAMVAQPADIASTSGMPNGSSQIDGNTNTSACA